jgi:alkylation response protein AidB-like acyl-CoA dehydrogenase
LDFRFTKSQEIFRQTVHEFLKKECPAEKIREWEEKEIFPYDLFDKMADLGWFGMIFPEAYGGSGGSLIDLIILIEELARQEFELASASGLTIIGGLNILRNGNEAQKSFYLPRITRGKTRFSISITEPGAGSDAASLITTAIRDGNDYLLQGQKTFATAAHLKSNIVQLAARTDSKVPKHRGITVFLVDPNLPGVTLKRIKTLGRKIQGTNEIFLDRVKVPEECVLGKVNEGWSVLLANLEVERVIGAISYTGAAQSAVDEALRYAKKREQFGQPIGNFQAIAHMLVDMQTEVEAARLLSFLAAWRLQEGLPSMKQVSMAKLFSSETYVKVANCGMQIMGGYGYTMEYDMQRHFRLARLATIGAGTSQIQRNIIARKMGLTVR